MINSKNSQKLRSFKNIYVKDYKKFPYVKLTGSKTLNYTGKIIFYSGSVPITFEPASDIVFDCDCEFEEWSKLNKVFD